jgi:hypothetical protein
MFTREVQVYGTLISEQLCGAVPYAAQGELTHG